MSPQKVVYVSCDPATLARDVKLLTERGYKLTHAEAVDLFPRCSHIESIVCLSREKADDYIRISVHTDDLKAKAN
jgi:23S rRNA (uracil1939-C5)-methyltransferase